MAIITIGVAEVDLSDVGSEAFDEIENSFPGIFKKADKDTIEQIIKEACSGYYPEVVEVSIPDLVTYVQNEGSGHEMLRLLADGENILEPIISADRMNNYEFKRYICDLLEVGYQTDSLTLISTLIDKIDPQWRLIL